MGHGDDGAFVLVEVLLQPVDALGIEVVGGLIEEEDVGLLQQKAAQGHAAALTSGEEFALLVGRWAVERGHGAVEAAVEIPSIGGVDDVL